MPIYRPSELHQLGVKAKKRLSQNFLIDQNILDKICKAADIQLGDHVLEIGPGPGALTEHLLSKGAKVTVIEKDPDLAKKLERLTQKDLTIYCGDALTFPLETLSNNLKIVANLPYHITTPLIERFIQRFPKIFSLTVMVQKEVGMRMTAEVNSSLYSSFTLFLKAFSSPQYCFTVKPNSFFPAPSVYSAVIHLPLHSFPFSFSEDPFFTLIRKAFNTRRKMIRTSLCSLYDKEKLTETLESLFHNSLIRPQELSLQDFATLFETLEEIQKN